MKIKYNIKYINIIYNIKYKYIIYNYDFVLFMILFIKGLRNALPDCTCLADRINEALCECPAGKFDDGTNV